MLPLLRLMAAFGSAIVTSARTSVGARFVPEQRRLAYRLKRQSAGARALCWCFGIRVHPQSDTEFPAGVLRVSNHLTAIDPVVLASQMTVCFAGKAEIGRWPILGWVCRAHAMLLVDRHRHRATRVFAEQVRDRLAQGASVLVFPEATTGPGDRLLPFKPGAFESVASWERGRVQPVFMDVQAINGSAPNGTSGREAVSHTRHPNLIRHLWSLCRFRKLDFSLHAGAVVPTHDLDRKTLARTAQAAVAELGGAPEA